MDIVYGLDQDKINILINKNVNVTNLYGALTQKDVEIIMVFYKLFNDYGANYKSKDIELADIKILIDNTCQNLSRCVRKKLYQSYRQIICNERLVKNYTKKLQFFYKYYINKNTQNMLSSIKRKHKKLNELWSIVKFSNKKEVYSKKYLDSSC